MILKIIGKNTVNCNQTQGKRTQNFWVFLNQHLIYIICYFYLVKNFVFVTLFYNISTIQFHIKNICRDMDYKIHKLQT